MQMFPTLLDSIPKTRPQLVNEVDIPEVTLSPYIWVEPEESIITRSDSVLTGSIEEFDSQTLSTDSSMPLSRAITDSEIDYERYRRLKSRSFSDPWDHMRAALDAFPPGYLTSLNSFMSSLDNLDSLATEERWGGYNEELRLKMERFFDEECKVFESDDPGLQVLEEALLAIDDKSYDSDLDTMSA